MIYSDEEDKIKQAIKERTFILNRYVYANQLRTAHKRWMRQFSIILSAISQTFNLQIKHKTYEHNNK